DLSLHVLNRPYRIDHVHKSEACRFKGPAVVVCAHRLIDPLLTGCGQIYGSNMQSADTRTKFGALHDGLQANPNFGPSFRAHSIPIRIRVWNPSARLGGERLELPTFCV